MDRLQVEHQTIGSDAGTTYADTVPKCLCWHHSNKNIVSGATRWCGHAIATLAREVHTPRELLDRARQDLYSWLEAQQRRRVSTEYLGTYVNLEGKVNALRQVFEEYKIEHLSCQATWEQKEQYVVGCIAHILKRLLRREKRPPIGRAECQYFVLPENVVINVPRCEDKLCIAVVNASGHETGGMGLSSSRAFGRRQSRLRPSRITSIRESTEGQKSSTTGAGMTSVSAGAARGAI